MMIMTANHKDIKNLNFLINSSYRGEISKKGWTTEADLLDGLRTDEAALEEIINENNSVILKCLDEDGLLVGCVYLQKQHHKLYLGMLTVSPLHQNNGIGKKLLNAAEEYAINKNCSSIIMTVISIRRELIEWYERHGYEKTGETKPFHHNGIRFGIPKMPLEFLVLQKNV
jgi:ribosomal protein S18 acetylase RimI-like enzyme